MQRIKNLLVGFVWETLRTSLWFLPSLMMVVAIALALALVSIDAAISSRGLSETLPRVFGAGAEGSREMLSAIATSMITIAGVAFSITIVALSLASSQYSSRILRNFMRDRANQTVLGAFVGIYVYCLIVLRTVRGGDSPFVPSLAVLVAVLLAFVGIGCFIFFIHHIAASIQAESIIKSAADETRQAIDRLFPAEIGQGHDENEDVGELLERQIKIWRRVACRRAGFIQSIDGDALMNIAVEQKTVVRVERMVGDFVVEGTNLLSVAEGAELSDELISAFNDIFTVGHQRTLQQDAGFGIRQIVDVALKALSSGINDTTTAVTCVNYLSALMAQLASRRFESPHRFKDGELRVIAHGETFTSMLEGSFDQIRQNASGNVAVLLAMLHAIETIESQVESNDRREALKRQVRAIAKQAKRSVDEPMDLEKIDRVLSHLSLKNFSIVAALGGGVTHEMTMVVSMELANMMTTGIHWIA